ncbi:extracellular catalytic domain type 1 short-chain-length polyhydroxyalkanoate depolymerase [Aquisphaera insulae]|uniref:extracellular catalytic domain type 1 short-chain-length polyhydroxyalkanoate depolymerase n=1 Tax=Aquisphaera insulae TaxID=2712864 RepID=UPI0013ED78D9|nr:PHB depolymerase family esterase [Aquisphaera insulae]
MIAASALVCLGLSLASAAPLKAGDHLQELTVGGSRRSYIVHVPPGYDASRPTPVVLVYHSAMMNAAIMAGYCGMGRKADEAGFLLVYPNGTGTTSLLRYWDSGGVRGQRSDDVGYTSALLDDLATRANVDPKRVYAAGMSNGAMMCYRLAAELSHRIAAIATVAGTMAIDECHPRRPVPVIHFHGTRDSIVPTKGADPKLIGPTRFLSLEATMDAWLRADGCPPIAAEATLPDADTEDGTRVRRRTFGPGKDDSEIVLYLIENGGHTWPGSDVRNKLLGLTTRDISANDLIWEFFRKHPMK